MALSHNFPYISTSVLFSVIIGLELSFDLVLLMYFFFLQLITSSIDHANVDQEITVRNVEQSKMFERKKSEACS